MGKNKLYRLLAAMLVCALLVSSVGLLFASAEGENPEAVPAEVLDAEEILDLIEEEIEEDTEEVGETPEEIQEEIEEEIDEEEEYLPMYADGEIDVYEEPDPDSKKIDKLQDGEYVEVRKYDDNWQEWKKDDVIQGYIQFEDLRSTPEAAIPAGQTEDEEPENIEPIVEDPVVEEPVIDEIVIDTPVVLEPVVEEPVVEETLVDEPVVEEPIVEEPVVEEPIVEEPVVE